MVTAGSEEVGRTQLPAGVCTGGAGEGEGEEGRRLRGEEGG